MRYSSYSRSSSGCGRMFLSIIMAAAIFVCGIKVGAAHPDVLTDTAFSIGRAFSHFRDARPVIAIDAGHGGDDPGAEGMITEAELTADAAEKLFALLEEDGRFRPVYCHAPGETASISERYETANKVYADLLVCIHANSDPNGNGSGFECYPAPPGRKYHEESVRFAQLTVQAFTELGISIRGENGIRYAYYDNEDQKYIVESSDTSVHSDSSFGMLEKTRAPAVLMEQCFVTNAGDLALLYGEEGTMRAVNAYYKAICGYFADTLAKIDEKTEKNVSENSLESTSENSASDE